MPQITPRDVGSVNNVVPGADGLETTIGCPLVSTLGCLLFSRIIVRALRSLVCLHFISANIGMVARVYLTRLVAAMIV